MGRHSSVDLLVITSLDQLLFLLQILCKFMQSKQPYVEVNCIEPSPWLVFPACTSIGFAATKRFTSGYRFKVEEGLVEPD